MARRISVYETDLEVGNVSILLTISCSVYQYRFPVSVVDVSTTQMLSSFERFLCTEVLTPLASVDKERRLRGD